MLGSFSGRPCAAAIALRAAMRPVQLRPEMVASSRPALFGLSLRVFAGKNVGLESRHRHHADGRPPGRRGKR